VVTKAALGHSHTKPASKREPPSEYHSVEVGENPFQAKKDLGRTWKTNNFKQRKMTVEP
jgi:hypothetical protein